MTGIAGSAEKCAELKKLGVHHALNYKDKDFRKQLRKVGLVDLYFDNGKTDRPLEGVALSISWR